MLCENRYDTVSGSSQGEGAEAKAEARAKLGAEAGPQTGAKAGAEAGAEARSEEQQLLDTKRSVVSLEIIDTEESILVTTGEGDLATEIIEHSTSRVTLETVYTPKRIRYALLVLLL